METSINNYNYQREKYYFGMQIDMRKTFVNFGRWLERDNLEDTIINYEEYLNNSTMIENKNIISNFVDRLLKGDYKVILYNGQTPILEDDTGIVDLILQDINENTNVELNGDILTIHNEEEKIELKGYEDMSDGEIFARKYLDSCDCDLIIKDSLEQVEFREENFIDIDQSLYNRCKDVTNIRLVPEDSEHYNMNWDCIIVKFKGVEMEEFWQRA